MSKYFHDYIYFILCTNVHESFQVHRKYVGTGQFDRFRGSSHYVYQTLLAAIIKRYPIRLKDCIRNLDTLLFRISSNYNP